MQRSLLLARSNLRRAKGRTAAIAVLILFAAFMLNLWLMLAMDYKQNFVRYHDTLQEGHVTLVIDKALAETEPIFCETLANEAETTAFCMNPCMSMVGSFAYNGGEMNSEFILLEKQAALNRSVGKMEIVEDSTFTSGIYLPMIYKTGEISVGNEIEIQIGSHTVRYTVCGFFNSVMAGSHNCSLCALLLTEDQYRILENMEYAPQATLLSVRISDPSHSESFEAMLKNRISAQYPEARILSNSYALVSSSRYISQMICSGIVSAMAFLVLLIAIAVIASDIVHYVRENMKNLGALKAVGYTSRQLIGALLLQFSGISLISAAVGAGCSYFLFPFVNTMMISQTGIPYAVHFLPLPFLLALLLPVGMVTIAVWLSARKIKRIEPITALRGGIRTHHFKRNRVPLAATNLPLNFALALKTTLSGIKQNITVCITVLVLSLVVVFSALMAENVIADITPFLNMVVGETADSCINIHPEIEETFLRELRQDPRVEKIYLYTSFEVRHVGGVGLMATLSEDFSQVNNPDVCVEGRFPKYENETAIAAKYAQEKHLKIGDEIFLTLGDKEAGYLISGFTQISNHLGKDCLLTRAGYERIGMISDLSYYLNLAESADVDSFNEEIRARYDHHVNTVLNILSVIDGTASVYVSLMTVIVIAILVLSILVVVFVLYLLVRTMLHEKKHDYGILKAVGFTTKQLILQTAWSFLPALILSFFVGLTVSCLVINPLTAVFLSGIGIVKCTFDIPVLLIVLAGIGLIFLSFAMVCLLSLRVKRIAPRAMLMAE